jgi:uncharacterized protein
MLLPSIILKIASRCNLNCAYCYVYNKEDQTWRNRPPLMSDDVFKATVDRIKRHCLAVSQRHVHVFFHGGEPSLLGPTRFAAWCAHLRQALDGIAAVEFGIQTNGTLLNHSWIDVFRKNRVSVGVSLDGPKWVHDSQRIDHSGRGSYDRVVRGLTLLREGSIEHRILCVIPLGISPLTVHHHLLSFGCNSLTYIFPDFTHDTVHAIRDKYGPTPCADFMIPIFDNWWFNGTMNLRINDLWNIARIILGGESQIETLGGMPPRYVFVETDGEIEGLDCLRCCEEGLSRTDLNVRNSDFIDIATASPLHSEAIFKGLPLPTACRNCPEEITCAGGYLPHRYSRDGRFDNPSIWCHDILKLFKHMRERLDVSIQQTKSFRDELQQLCVNGTSLLGRPSL